MKHLHTKIKQHLKKEKSSYIVFLSVFSLFLLLSSFFYLTKSSDPHTSELAFIETSPFGQGSVIPASCPSAHDGECCSPLDCFGVCGGSAVDIGYGCGVQAPQDNGCGPGNPGPDACGVCGGNGSSCAPKDCFGTPWGTAVVDACGVCGGNGSSCTSCVPDACDQANPGSYFTDQCCTGTCSGYRCGTVVRTCANGGLSGPIDCPVGTWVAPTCPTACGQPASSLPYTCSGGTCSGARPANVSCPATAACVPNVNCVGSWTDNGVCSVSGSCGQTGSYGGTYHITTPQSGSGTACPYADGATRTSGGASCSTAACPSGTISATPNPCLMGVGQTSCSTGLTWNTFDPIGTSNVTKAGNIVVFTGNSGTNQSTTIAAARLTETYYLNNNAQTLASVSVPIRCDDGLWWNGAAGCAPCGNGGCTGTGGDPSTPFGGLVCKNGVNNVPTCIPQPVVSLKLNGVTDIKLSNYPGNNAVIAWDGTLGSAAAQPTSCAIPSNNFNPAAAFAPYKGSGNTNQLPEGVTLFSYSCTNGGGTSMAEATATVCPLNAPVLHKDNSCQPAPVAGFGPITGNYTSSAKATITCQNSNYYILTKNNVNIDGSENAIPEGTPFYSAIRTLTSEGDYKLECGYHSLDGHTFQAFSANTIKYRSKPPEPVVTLMANPASIGKGSASVLSWIVMFPNSVQSPARPACSIFAKPVCTGTCTQAQLEASTTVNQILRDGFTDANDPANGSGGPRRISPDAINTLPAGHSADDWRATGRKTFNLEKSMDFKLQCGGVGTQSSSTVRVIVTSSNEG